METNNEQALSQPILSAGVANELHSAIMNLPCVNPHKDDLCGLYAQGHRDARHAAAELASAALTSAPAAPAAPLMTDADISTLRGIAEWLSSSTNVQQIGPDEWSHASQFDYELAQAADEISAILRGFASMSADAQSKGGA